MMMEIEYMLYIILYVICNTSDICYAYISYVIHNITIT